MTDDQYTKLDTILSELVAKLNEMRRAISVIRLRAETEAEQEWEPGPV